jgi:DNA-binding NarL/FixJ family response regulator
MGRKPKTPINDEDIIALHAEGCGDREIAEILGVSTKCITNHRKRLGLPKNKTRRRMKVYAMYSHDGSQLIAMGTVNEISEVTGYTVSTIRSYVSKTRAGEPFMYKVEVHRG